MLTNVRNKVVRLVTRSGNATSLTPRDVLMEAMGQVKPSDKVMVLFHSADIQNYCVDYIQCGMTAGEMLTLLEVAKLNIFSKLMANDRL